MGGELVQRELQARSSAALRRFWKEILLFGAFFGILLYCSPLDITQIGFGDKGFYYLYGAKYEVYTYPAPFYLTLGWLVTRAPWLDGFMMSFFLSALPALGTAILVHVIVREKTKNVLAAWVATLVLMTSWVFFIQAVKVESYCLIAFLTVLAYYLMTRPKPKNIWAQVAFGLAIASHWFDALPAWLALSVYRRQWKWILVAPAVGAGIFFGWMYWFSGTTGDSAGVGGIFTHTEVLFRSILWGGNLKDVGERFTDVSSVIITSCWLAAVPAFIYFIKGEAREKVPIFFICAIPLAILAVGKYPAAYMHFAVAVPFLAIAAGFGVPYMSSMFLRRVVPVTLIAGLIAMPFVFGNLDTNPTQARKMINYLDDVPDGSLIYCDRIMPDGRTDRISGALTEFCVRYHNEETGSNNIPVPPQYVMIGYADSVEISYDDELRDQGVNLPCHDSQAVYLWEDDWESNIFLGAWRLKVLNPEKKIYIYRMEDVETWQTGLYEVVEMGEIDPETGEVISESS